MHRVEKVLAHNVLVLVRCWIRSFQEETNSEVDQDFYLPKNTYIKYTLSKYTLTNPSQHDLQISPWRSLLSSNSMWLIFGQMSSFMFYCTYINASGNMPFPHHQQKIRNRSKTTRGDRNRVGRGKGAAGPKRERTEESNEDRKRNSCYQWFQSCFDTAYTPIFSLCWCSNLLSFSVSISAMAVLAVAA